jgi:hypothetical protein
MMGNFHLENHTKWYQNRQAIETALHGNARQERTLRLQSTPYSESRLLVNETGRMSELSVLDITAFNERRGASSLDVYWQHHQASIRTCKSIEGAIIAVKEEQITPSDETNNDDCIAVPRPIDVLMGREKLAFTHVGNSHYQYLIGEYQDRYDACETRIEKTIIASTLAMKIKESGGRFLLRKKGETTWSEAAESVVSEKVTNAFRGRRKTAIKRNKRSYDGTPDTASKRRLPDVYEPYS